MISKLQSYRPEEDAAKNIEDKLKMVKIVKIVNNVFEVQILGLGSNRTQIRAIPREERRNKMI